MRPDALVALLILAALVPGSVAAACDWTVTPSVINNTAGGPASTINDMSAPWEDGNDVGHTGHDCGIIHLDPSDLDAFCTVAWPAGYVGGDYVLCKYRVTDETGLVLEAAQKTIWFPATTSSELNEQDQVANGTHNYTISARTQFVDAVGPLDIPADSNCTVLWQSFLNAERPVITWNNPNAPDTENEIISASVDATDATYSIFDVYASVQLANNTDDPFIGGCAAVCIPSVSMAPAGGNEYTKTFDMDSDGNAAWNTANHPWTGVLYKTCSYARNTPLQWSNTTCENFTFSTSGGGGGPSANGTGTLRGTVFENTTGVPASLEGVLVTVTDIGWVTTSTEFGHFYFYNIPIENYTIRLAKSGYETKDHYQTWDHSDNDTFTGLILLESGGAPTIGSDPLTDEEIQTGLRTYVPLVVVFLAICFVYIVAVETLRAGGFK